MIYTIWLLAGAAIGAIIALLAGRPALKRGEQAEHELRNELDSKNGQLIELNRQVAESRTQCRALEERIVSMQNAYEREELRRKEEETTRMQQQQAAFKNLANDILEEKSRQFKQTSSESLEQLLKPFRENLENFRKRVDEVYDNEAQQRFSLKEEIRRLNEANLRMSEEANNLTQALKGNSKVQGDWGEMILDTILGGSHLSKGIHYFTQENLKDEAGNNLRPDVILNLPGGKQIVIDSKVSLTDYIAYTESTTAEEASKAIKNHLRSVRSHINELGNKQYQTLVNSPDFVIMFIPNEPAFLLALQQEPGLWNEAYEKKVIVSSPTNLFALLKLVDDLWKRDSQNKNAITIATEGANLYDKLVGFTETLTDLGRSITKTGEKYEQAVNQLKTGRGNLIRRANKLKDLLKVTKNMPVKFADYEDTDDPQLPSDSVPSTAAQIDETIGQEE